MKKRAMTLVEALVVIMIVLFIIFIFRYLNEPEYIPRSACASNLKQISTAMYLYGQDNNGIFPLIDFQQGKIVGEDVTTRNWAKGKIENPFKDIPSNAGRSISQNLWLLVRGELIQVEIFNCPSSKQAKEKCNMYDLDGETGDTGPNCFVDFPWNKSDLTISYSFVQPWSVFGKDKDAKKLFWSTAIDEHVIIGADINDGRQPNYTASNKPISTNDLKSYVNSTNHKGDGQNTLYGDGHVVFNKSAYVGVNNDNIYTAEPKDYKGKAEETAGVLSVRPANENDSVLVPNREEDLKNWDRVP